MKTWPSNPVKTNCRPAAPLDTRPQFGRAWRTVAAGLLLLTCAGCASLTGESAYVPSEAAPQGIRASDQKSCWTDVSVQPDDDMPVAQKIGYYLWWPLQAAAYLFCSSGGH
jgi:hypothetical protein